MFALLKALIKVFLLFIVLGSIALAILYRDQAGTVFDKIAGMYYIELGDRALKKYEFQTAIELYKRGLTLYPEHTKAGCNLANIFVQYENYNEAVDTYRKALRNDNKSIVCRMNLGIVLAESVVDYDAAIDEYTKVTKAKLPLVSVPYFYSNKKTARENQGLAYYNMGVAYRGKAMLKGERTGDARPDLLKSVEMYKKALKILGKDYNTQYNLALTNHLLGDIKEAKRGYCKAISMEPLNYEAHYNLAVLLRSLKMYRESMEELEKTSLILDLQGDANISRYVFDVLNDVYQKIIITENGSQYLVERFESGFQQDHGVTYIKGKLVVPDEFDRAMLKNFKTCVINDKI